MSRISLTAVCTALVMAGCSQFTTNDTERAALRTAADNNAEAYLGCIRQQADQYQGTVASADLVFTAVAGQCETELDQFRSAANTYYTSKVMLTEQPVDAEVDELSRRARNMIAVGAIGTAGLPAARNSQPAVYAPTTAAASTGATSAAVAADRQAYLDCMSEQARRYAPLDESAATIAEVAQDTCRDKRGSAASSALDSEGRTLVLREVLEARVAR